jgi:hypothetical protein
VASAVVVACTNGKSRTPVAHLGAVRRKNSNSKVSRLFDAWRGRLDGPGERVAAEELYSGVAWAASRELAAVARAKAPDTQFWVLSAGYGLVSARAGLLPYAATFSPDKSDSIRRAGDGPAINRSWWHLLVNWRPAGHDGPRSLTELAATVDGLMIVMSPRYLDAALDDLLVALAGPAGVVVSAGLADSHPLAPLSLRFDKRLREPEDVTGRPRLVDASDMSLNQRVAAHLVNELGADGFRRDAAQQYLDRAMEARRPARTFRHRVAANDDEVAEFVEAQLLADPRTSKTALLRSWRKSGRQCEQKRFGRIFHDVKTAFELAQPTPDHPEFPL